MSDTLKYTAQVIQDENGELALLFDAEMISHLGWQDGDVVDWNITDQGIIVSRVKPEDLE